LKTECSEKLIDAIMFCKRIQCSKELGLAEVYDKERLEG
jgi:hypothetical protein